MLKVLMRFVGLGAKQQIPEPKVEPKKESTLPQELIDEIKRWRYIQGYANSLRAHMGER